MGLLVWMCGLEQDFLPLKPPSFPRSHPIDGGAWESASESASFLMNASSSESG